MLKKFGAMSQAAAFATPIMLSVIVVLLVVQGLLRLLGVRNVSLIG